MKFDELIRGNDKRLALVIGNGINRYTSSNGNNSWDTMLLKLWGKHVGKSSTQIPLGISLTEFYDALDLSSKIESTNLQKEFCSLMADWQPKQHHKDIVDWAQDSSVPILTTNFEETLSSNLGVKIRHTDPKKFTDFYPWGSYFSSSEIYDPSTRFAIWHINGVQKYSRSIRLGLTHYMGSVERARRLLHKGSETRLFSGKNEWAGFNTWLHVIFNNDLLFLGLGLDTSEIFLRWLLIERAKYFRKFPERRRSAFFAYAGDDMSPGQEMFLECVGFEVIKESSYESLYRDAWT